MTTASAGKRISGLDTARALAIALAMTSHCFIHFGVWPLLTDEVTLLVRSMTRSATPTFIVLFGMMLEIVYLKTIRRGDRAGCWTRLLTRALQCYLLYLCVVAAGILGGQLTASEGAKAALFLSEAYFANILKFYSLGLVLGILLLELRVRFGLAAAVAAIAAIWFCYPLIQSLPELPEGLRHLASFLIGAGAETGPSVLQGMSFAAFGMLLGHGVAGSRSDDAAVRRRSQRLLLALGLLALGAAAVCIAWLGLRPALESFTDYRFRAANHPLYYVFGSAFGMALIAGCIVVAAALPASLLARLNVFGTSSLFAYGFGNIVLNLLPSQSGSLALGLVFSLAFLACLYGVTCYFQLTVQAQTAGGPDYPVAARLGRLHGGLRHLTARIAGLFVARLLPGAGLPGPSQAHIDRAASR
jgi:hypothetical protein